MIAPSPTPMVSYRHSEHADADLRAIIAELSARPDVVDVCELGAGANPSLSLHTASENDIRLWLLDISAHELAKAPDGYQTIVQDLCSAAFEHEARFDLVFSRMLLEHLPDAAQFHSNVHRALRPGGYAVHLFPTLWAPHFAVNKIAPEALSDRLLRVIDPGRDYDGRQGKFPAYYDHCRGPSTRQLAFLASLGFEIVEYRGYFGARGYYDRIGLGAAEERLARAMVKRPHPSLTSYAVALLRSTPLPSPACADSRPR